MGESLRQAADREFGFNVNQLRGPDGRWIKAGSTVRSAEHGNGTVKSVNKATGKATVRFEDSDSDTGQVTKEVPASTLRTVDRKVDMSPAAKKKRAKNLDNLDKL